MCINTEGSYECGCEDGYTLSSVDGKTCIGEIMLCVKNGNSFMENQKFGTV